MSQREKQQIQVEDDYGQKDGGEDVYNMFRTMWTGVLRRTKYKPNLGYNIIYNSVIPYLMALIMTGLKFFEGPENEQINSWLKRNPIVLDKMMMNM